eukprot:SAG11_NODE_1297_length_5269_cov_3.432302_5_plen_176_part_00
MRTPHGAGQMFRRHLDGFFKRENNQTQVEFSRRVARPTDTGHRQANCFERDFSNKNKTKMEAHLDEVGVAQPAAGVLARRQRVEHNLWLAPEHGLAQPAAGGWLRGAPATGFSGVPAGHACGGRRETRLRPLPAGHEPVWVAPREAMLHRHVRVVQTLQGKDLTTPIRYSQKKEQ